MAHIFPNIELAPARSQTPARSVVGNKTTKDTTEENTMEEQNELNDLKKLMERQQKTLTETMSAMELKATALQEKLDKKAVLSSANAEAGVKKIALEYKVVELKIDYKLPSGFNYGFPKDEEPHSTSSFGFKPVPKEDPYKAFKFTVPDDKAVNKECEEETLKKHREFEETKLKELGEEGWTLRSIVPVMLPIPTGYTNLYYFSRPL